MRMQLSRAIRYAHVPPAALLVSFAPGQESSRDYCSDSNRCAKLEDILKKLTGKNTAIRFDIAQDVTVAATLPKAMLQKQQVMQVPLAKAIIDHLGGQLVHMDDGFGE